MPANRPDPAAALLSGLGRRVRALRKGRGMTIEGAAEAAGMSSRFLADVEAGRGNLSVVRLLGLARALCVPAARLLEGDGPKRVALLGLRGAGKSTVGRLLAQRLSVPFEELDALVEEAAGLPLAELFAVHGEAYYRRVERECLLRLLRGADGFVLAAGGGVVTDPETYALLSQGCTTVWLKARPEEHMARVAAQGDLRPMARSSDAMTELKGILAERAPLYARADHAVETSGTAPAKVADRVLATLAP
jgi:XRE family aerobic/anaerobic benzoate catabolism transcriptional regulator